MSINLTTPETTELKPRITVFGVGGAGGNAVNNMIGAHLEGVEFVVTNTDAQSLSQSLTDRRIQLGVNVTQGLGAGSRPEVGNAAANEAMHEIMDHIQGSHMVFITAGMGGGTGTGAAPVIAQAAREAGMLTVGVVTKPFHFEGKHRMQIAEAGITELQRHVDTLIIIPNQNLFRVANEKTTFADAFKMADDVLYSGVRGVTDLMVMPGLINLDFADVRAVMGEMGKAMMGTGEAEGEKRSMDAAEAAIANPLLDDVSMKGARGVLINITGGMDMTLYEVDEAANRIRDEVDPDANIIFGSTFDEALEGRMRVSIVATGIEAEGLAAAPLPKLQVVGGADALEQGLPGEIRPQGTLGQPALDLPMGIPNLPGVDTSPTAPAMSNAPASKLGAPVVPPMSTASSPTAPAMSNTPMPMMGGQAQALAMAEPEFDADYEMLLEAELETAPTPAVEEAAIPEPTIETNAEQEQLDSFIARPAMASGAKSAVSSETPDPFAEAALTNGAKEKKVTRGPSLLERMTGTGRARQKTADKASPNFGMRDAAGASAKSEPTITAPEPVAETGAAEPAVPEAPAKKPEPLVKMDAAPADPASLGSPEVASPEVKSTGSLPSIDAADRLEPAGEDDLLEIPAFLRRQAN